MSEQKRTRTQVQKATKPVVDKPDREEARATVRELAGPPALIERNADMGILPGSAPKNPPSRGGGDGIPPEVVTAYGTALEPAALGTAIGPDDAALSAGIARSTAYKLRTELAKRNIFTKTRSWRVDPATKGNDTPHYWAVVKITEAEYRQRTPAEDAA